MNRSSDLSAMPMIPDHQLIRRIGEGSYGQIWLARNIVGTYRAVKIVYRSNFQDARPYEREFKGIQEFEPISRSHPGLVDILQIGRNDEAGYFYYVMELADDEVAGGDFHPDNYCAKTLGRVWESQGRIAATESLQIGMNLAAALAHMHRHELVHRDVKPSNIIFVQGQPKLADIGLVVALSDARTFVGTEGYIPPEGPGSIQADIYSLGKVLYEISTGQDRQSFPELPADLAVFSDRAMVVELNEIVVKACANSPKARYGTAEEMRNDLEFLLSGRSVKRLRFVERQLARTARVAAVAIILAIAAGLLAFGLNRVRQREKRLLAESIAISGIARFEEGNLHASLPLFAEALRLEKDDPAAAATHRLRIGSALEQSPRLLQFWHHNVEAKDLCFSPDGKTLAVSAGRVVHLMDFRAGKLRLDIPTRHTIETARYNREGTRLVITSGDYVRVTEAETGAQVFEVKMPGHPLSAEFSPDGAMIALGCRKSCLHLIDARTGKLLGDMRGHASGVNYANFSPDGTLLATGGQDGVARIWNVSSRELLHTLPQTQWVFDAAFSPDGRRVVTACSDHRIRLWDPVTGYESGARMEHRGEVRRARFSPDGRWIVSAGLDKTVRLWNARDGSSVISILNLHSPALQAAFSTDGRRVATASQRGEVHVWDIAPNPPLHVGFGIVTEDGQRYITYRSNSFQIWNARDDSPLAGPFLTGAEIQSVRASASGKTVVAIGKTNSSMMASVDVCVNGKLVRSFLVPAAVDSVVSPDGNYLLRFGKDGASVWSTETAEIKFATKERAERGAFSPDGRLVGIALKSRLIAIVLASGQELFSAPDEKLEVSSLNFSADSARLVAAVSDVKFSAGYARVMDARFGKTLCTITQHTDGVRSAVFSPRGDFVATAGEDSQIGVWDAATGKARIDPITLTWPASFVSVSADNRWLAATTWHDSQVFEVHTGRAATPIIQTPWIGIRSGFFADGKRLWILTTNGLFFSNLPIADRSPDEVIALADRLGVTIPTPLRWDPNLLPLDEMHRRCEQQMAESDRRTESWHRQSAGAAEEEKDWFAAQFHLQKLLQQWPADAELRARWQLARSHWLGSAPAAP